MTKNFKITVDGRSYTVAVEDLPPTTAASSLVAPTPTPVKAAPAPAAPAPVVTHPAPAPPPSAAGEPGGIEAPIGGMVRSIDVEVGHVVAVGDKVAVIEVMKMKTEVRSKIAGKVTGITAKVNEPIETGQQMMTVG